MTTKKQSFEGLLDPAGAVQRAPRVLIYGGSGRGKTTLASKFPEPLIIDTEDGSGMLDIRYRKRVSTYDELANILESVRDTRPTCIKTVCIDTIDWLFEMVEKKVLQERNAKSVADLGYEKFNLLKEKMVTVLRILEQINNAGYAILLIAHARDEMLRLPGQDPYRAWNIKITGTEKPAQASAEKVKEWVDERYFLDTDVSVDKRGTATGGTVRILHTASNATIVAKSRLGLPSPMVLTDDCLAPLFERVKGVQEEPESGWYSYGLCNDLQEWEGELYTYCLEKHIIRPGGSLHDISDEMRARMNANPQGVIKQLEKYR